MDRLSVNFCSINLSGFASNQSTQYGIFSIQGNSQKS